MLGPDGRTLPVLRLSDADAIASKPPSDRPVFRSCLSPTENRLAPLRFGAPEARFGKAPPAPFRPISAEKRPVWQPSQRYPDPAIEVLDASFGRYHLASAAV